MSWNKNSGYGQLMAQDIHSGLSGKLVVVGKDSLVHKNKLKQIFSHDDDGKLHFVDTLDAAMSYCEEDAGDRVVIMPGHTETVSSAGAIALDVGGVQIIGLGQGTARPTFTLDTAATANIAVSDDDISIENCVFSANYADIVKCFALTTAKNFKLKSCGFKATATNMNFLALVDTNTTDNAADGLTFDNCSWIEPDAATVSMVTVDGDLDGLNVKNCYANLGVNTSDLPIVASVATGKDLTNLKIEGNSFIRLNDANYLLVNPDTTSANTGVIKDNFIRHADTGGEALMPTGSAVGFKDNKASAVADASGYLLPAADS